MYAVVLFHISFIPDRPTNLSYVPTFKKVGITGGGSPQRSEFEAAHCRKGRNSQRRPAANRSKPNYRLFPTVSIALATHRPLKRSEFEAAHCRKGRNSQRRPAANRSKPNYRLFPTVSIALATHRPLKRSEFEAAHCRIICLVLP